MKKIIFLFVLALAFLQCQVDVEPKRDVDLMVVSDDVPLSRKGSSYCEPEIDPDCELLFDQEATFFNVDLLEPCSELGVVTIRYDVQICKDENDIVRKVHIFNVDIYWGSFAECEVALGNDANAFHLVLSSLLSKLSVELEQRLVTTHIGDLNRCPKKHMEVTSFQRSCYYYVPDLPLQYCGEKCCSRKTSYCWIDDENGEYGLKVTPIENIESGDCGLLGGNGQTYECQNECALGIAIPPDPVSTDEF